MNVTEANAVARVLRFLADLEVVERRYADDLDEEQLAVDVWVLGNRVRRALGAGPDPLAVAEHVESLLLCAGADGRPVEDVQVAGGAAVTGRVVTAPAVGGVMCPACGRLARGSVHGPVCDNPDCRDPWAVADLEGPA